MKKLITLLLSLFFITSLYSLPPRSPAHSKPGKKDVIIVGKIAFTDSINAPIEGYTKLFYPKNNSDDFNYIYFILDEDMTDSIWGAYVMNRSYKNWDFNQTFYFDNKPDQNNIVRIAEIHSSLFANKDWVNFFRIPLSVEVTCPTDAKFVYAGTYNEFEVVTGFLSEEFAPRNTCIYSSGKFAADIICRTIANNSGMNYCSALIPMPYGEGNYSMQLINVVLKKLLVKP